jgi:hypothetical protein
MGSVGDCFDNAMCESFFATLECELLDRRRFKTQVEARMAVFEFIEGWYNPHRRHSALDYLSPINYEWSQQTESLTASPTPSIETGRLQDTWRARWCWVDGGSRCNGRGRAAWRVANLGYRAGGNGAHAIR